MREINKHKQEKKCVHGSEINSVCVCVCVTPYLDDGRWWSDPVVAAGCMVLCLATCVLIIAELGVCGCQKEFLQLRMDPNRTRKVGEEEGGGGGAGSQRGLCKWHLLIQFDFI